MGFHFTDPKKDALAILISIVLCGVFLHRARDTGKTCDVMNQKVALLPEWNACLKEDKAKKRKWQMSKVITPLPCCGHYVVYNYLPSMI